MVLVLGGGCGTDAGENELGTLAQAVELDQRGVYYDIAFAPAPSLQELRAKSPAASDATLAETLLRELTAQAQPYWSSGSISMPALNASGDPLPPPAPAQVTLRPSCGATLIAPSFAVTAGHCLQADRLDVSQVRLRMYRPTPLLVDTYSAATVLSGSWPLFSHPKLAEADGYFADDYPCQVLHSCYASGGANHDCPNFGSDVALLQCQGRPGDKYGFLNVNRDDASGKESLMHWKHEILSPSGLVAPQEFVDHYVQYEGGFDTNYHYFDQQLLPLRSISWPGGQWTRFVEPAWVDNHGCHGTSGSGILVRVGQSVEFRLVGPAAMAGTSLWRKLCHHIPDPDGLGNGPGSAALGVSWFEAEQLPAQSANALRADCRQRAAGERDVDDLPFAAGSHGFSTLFSHLDCQPDGFGHDGMAQPDPQLGPYPERYVDAATPEERIIAGFAVEAGADYRLALHVSALAPCQADCGSLRVRVGAEVNTLELPSQGTSLASWLFAAPGAGPIQVGVTNIGQRRALGGFVLIREGQVNSFDTPEDRLEAALYALSGENVVVGPAPMRFVGDGVAGFAALLRPSERMALSRQAMAAGQRWTLRLGAASYDDLTCGLLDLRGMPVQRVPCAPLLQVDDSAGTEGRLGLYVELAATSARTETLVRYLALASGSARDADGDGTPEVLDNCPGDWNAAQADCNEEPAGPEEDASLDAGTAEAGAPPPAEDASVEAVDSGAQVNPPAELDGNVAAPSAADDADVQTVPDPNKAGPRRRPARAGCQLVDTSGEPAGGLGLLASWLVIVLLARTARVLLARADRARSHASARCERRRSFVPPGTRPRWMALAIGRPPWP
jgi:hypothetical protein